MVRIVDDADDLFVVETEDDADDLFVVEAEDDADDLFVVLEDAADDLFVVLVFNGIMLWREGLMGRKLFISGGVPARRERVGDEEGWSDAAVGADAR